VRGITAGRAHVRRSCMRTACPRGKVSVLHVFSRLQLLSPHQYSIEVVSRRTAFSSGCQ
jgi:hypothetical protein